MSGPHQWSECVFFLHILYIMVGSTLFCQTYVRNNNIRRKKKKNVLFKEFGTNGGENTSLNVKVCLIIIILYVYWVKQKKMHFLPKNTYTKCKEKVIISHFSNYQYNQHWLISIHEVSKSKNLKINFSTGSD